MKFVTYRPPPPLGRFVYLWSWEAPETPDGLDRILPKGTMGIILNLAEDEVRWYDAGDERRCRRDSGSVLVGPYADHFVIDKAEQRFVMGAEFAPGGAAPFFAPPASALVGQHVALDALWGREADFLRERVLAARTAEERLRIFASVLVDRLARPLETHPAVEYALARFAEDTPVAAVSDRLGMSPARFIRTFSDTVGLTPKRYLRVRRFQNALASLAAATSPSLADLGLSCGYYDQAHFIHDFRAFAGMTPTEYLACPRDYNHVTLD